MDEELLIELVSEKRFLYDKKSKLYKNTQFKEKTWNDIANILGFDLGKVKKKWITLRDMFIRDLRKNQQPSESGKKKFKHFQRLQFLKDAYRPRKTSINFEFCNAVDQDILSDESFEMLPIDLDEFEKFANSSLSITPLSKRTENKIEDAVGEETMKLIQDKKKGKTQPADVSPFAQNIDCLIKEANLPILKRVELEIKILNLIQNAIKNKNM